MVQKHFEWFFRCEIKYETVENWYVFNEEWQIAGQWRYYSEQGEIFK